MALTFTLAFDTSVRSVLRGGERCDWSWSSGQVEDGLDVLETVRALIRCQRDFFFPR